MRRIPRSDRYHLGGQPTSSASVPLLVRIALVVLAIPAAWIAICLLAVGGWLILPTGLVFLGVTRKRRRRSQRRRR